MVFKITSPEVLSVFGVTMLATLLLAGIYPALMLSSFKPMESMKGKLGRMGKKGSFRKALVVVQFSFSIILITSTIIIGRQLRYERDIDLGYDKENIITVNMRQEMSDHYDAIKASLLKQPGIQAVTAARQNIMNVGGGTADLDWDGKRPDQKSFLITICSIERDFIPTMHLQLLQGKGFSGTPADSAKYLFNETAIEQMGIKNPIGKSFSFRFQKGVIAGVVKDFHIANMHNKIDPLIMYFDPSDRHVLYVKTTGRDASTAVTALENMWKQYSPSYPFKYAFMDDAFADTYKADQQVGKLFNCFAIITILISCLGLLGLVTYTAETKVKEIGIRKTLGASVGSIVALLTKDFIMPVLIAAVIALPVAYWAMDMWLQNFAYRTTISWWVFVLAAIGAIAIALATISYQSIKAALMSPVKAIKME
jgi:large-conductance mechanosensitive channel